MRIPGNAPSQPRLSHRLSPMLNITAAQRAKDDRKTRRRGWYALATGLNTSFVVSYLICKPPSHTLSLTTRLIAPVIFIVVASIAGIFGTWMMLPTGEHDQLRSLSRIGLRGWIFLPSIALFLHQGSPLAPLIAIISATLIAISIHRLTASTTNLTPEPTSPKPNLFTTEIQISPSSWLPLALSLCLYASFAAATQKEIELLNLLLAIWTLVVTLQITAAQPTTSNQQSATNPRPYPLIAAALFCAFIALSLSANIWHDRYLGWAGAHSSGPKNPIATTNRSSIGYQTIVLWPLKKPEKVIPSPPVNIDPSASGTGKAWIIPFYGPYWYFKFPGEIPGPNAQTTHADPLKANVRSTDRAPLLMDAHQYLASPIDLTCCREIQVVFRNDATLGALAVALSLTDSQAKRSQNLGIKPVTPTQRPGIPSPTEETLVFSFPKSATITKFDAITVTLRLRAHARNHRKKSSHRKIRNDPKLATDNL
jgi:hypothetical protein